MWQHPKGTCVDANHDADHRKGGALTARMTRWAKRSGMGWLKTVTCFVNRGRCACLADCCCGLKAPGDLLTAKYSL